ncbi:MAG: putative Large-conductance mechanosensitive channel-like protein [Candidatus Saccharibacteria bacterium]|jgi:large conductance mechanosensitive channel|nr:putative Large-conductance mechanosensitive channel-like protein [Candidatus Saccharibacteria bacterium]
MTVKKDNKPTAPVTEEPSHIKKVAAKAVAVTRHGSGFMTFVREQGVVGLAVGLAIGTAAGASVKQIVEGLINPIVGFLIGGVDLTKVSWVVVEANSQGKGGLELDWGAVLSSLITLLATALVIYWLIHVAKLDRLDKKKQ